MLEGRLYVAVHVFGRKDVNGSALDEPGDIGIVSGASAGLRRLHEVR